jgi:hypothetical protein
MQRGPLKKVRIGSAQASGITPQISFNLKEGRRGAQASGCSGER